MSGPSWRTSSFVAGLTDSQRWKIPFIRLESQQPGLLIDPLSRAAFVRRLNAGEIVPDDHPARDCFWKDCARCPSCEPIGSEEAICWFRSMDPIVFPNPWLDLAAEVYADRLHEVSGQIARAADY